MNFTNDFMKEQAHLGAVYLRAKKKSEATINHNLWIWQQIDKYLVENEISVLNKDVIYGYITNKFGEMKICELSHYQKTCFSMALNLIQFMDTGQMLEKTEHIQRERPVFSGEIGSLIQDFLILKKSQRITDRTLGNYRWQLYCFQKFLIKNEISTINQISPLDILTYCSNLSPKHIGARHLTLCNLRIFLKYAYDEGKTSVNFSLVVPHDNYKQQPKLPSTYSKEEVKMILNTADRSTATGKRNYAILLMTVRLGLRASDIRALTYSNIIWSENRVSLIQSKTGEKVELPLPADVGDAIIDYLKYGRPISINKHLFLEHLSPYSELREKKVSQIANYAICHSGIDIGYRKHGSHALRHTMAGFLLEGKTPIFTISELLGHSNVKSTMSYLRIDIENLRQCALDVPIVNNQFYEQKGGVFYA